MTEHAIDVLRREIKARGGEWTESRARNVVGSRAPYRTLLSVLADEGLLERDGRAWRFTAIEDSDRDDAARRAAERIATALSECEQHPEVAWHRHVEVRDVRQVVNAVLRSVALPHDDRSEA